MISNPKGLTRARPAALNKRLLPNLLIFWAPWGASTGGKKKYPASIKFYDDGYNFEDPKAPYGIVNSYNLTQRLVSRVFLNPRAVDEPGSIVEGLPLKDALESARREIERQRAGSRREDEYAAADLAIVALLRGDVDWRDKLDDFLYSEPEPQPYAVQVTLDVLVELQGRLAETREGSPEFRNRVAKACDEIRRKIGA